MLPYVLICYQQYTMLPGIRPLQFNIKITFLSTIFLVLNMMKDSLIFLPSFPSRN